MLIADDDARVRHGLRGIIEYSADTIVVGEASSARSTLQLDRARRPDVVVLDLLLPRAEDGLGVLRKLSARGRPIVAISVWGFLRAQALACGASCFLEKNSQDVDQFVQAIRTAAANTTPKAPPSIR